MSVLTRDFYNRPAMEVARDLLGLPPGALAGRGPYGRPDPGDGSLPGRRRPGLPRQRGEDPPHCGHVRHARACLRVLHLRHALAAERRHGRRGHAGCGADPVPIHPVEGNAQMAANRPHNAGKRGWTDGPAKLTQALGIDGDFNEVDLCQPARGLWIENGRKIEDTHIDRTARVGLNSVPEPWHSIPLAVHREAGGA